ncbi:MAG: stage II sporulation protein R [Gemmiger sp.]|uniref:stage II sporulation protein R n=1 Tax=Gemmiger sp. TaxID=2049027 RepID=UPI0025BD7E1D|nr:stage II sporulation protein R [Gemmiger sp.]MEE0413279.1 stage II sporulation protein R [Gemmiger sp.]
MTKHTRRVLELGVGLALALAIVLTVGADWHQRTAAQVRADTLRLHILANSDTLDDQLLKLQVRDAVLAALPPAVTEAATPDEAVAALQYALPALQQAADTALHRAHSPQAARLRLEQWDFAARDYGSFTLPGGAYTALRIELGEARGRNWFCVLYPALCVSGSTAAYPTADENALVFGRFEVRCAVADFIGRWASPAGEAVSGLPAD